MTGNSGLMNLKELKTLNKMSKERTYKYVFKHISGATLKFDCKSIQEATILLSTIVSSVGDWDMRRFRY